MDHRPTEREKSHVAPVFRRVGSCTTGGAARSSSSSRQSTLDSLWVSYAILRSCSLNSLLMSVSGQITVFGRVSCVRTITVAKGGPRPTWPKSERPARYLRPTARVSALWLTAGARVSYVRIVCLSACVCLSLCVCLCDRLRPSSLAASSLTPIS